MGSDGKTYCGHCFVCSLLGAILGVRRRLRIIFLFAMANYSRHIYSNAIMSCSSHVLVHLIQIIRAI
ncbi:hypothetical protein BDZ91DRAFT_198539 [Kalaharituber pfeilii]|nr:hypothetical protein BDZ91DRAFT_198539 [Kalaharituber pfeilii]